jgi:probable FeS assembly SUF system protein SufT
MSEGGFIELSREIEAIQIPSGNKITLPIGTAVIINQALGGSYTVLVPHQAGLFRIAGDDADALGKEVVTHTAGDGPFDIEKVWEQLRNCYDPEIPVNIVDLGLIYGLDAADEEAGKRVRVKMTLTAPGCGMGEVLVADVRDKLKLIPTIRNTDVALVFDPPWNQSMMSEAARLQTGMM